MEINLKPLVRAFAIAIAALSAVFAFSAPLQAQDDSYVDLSIEVVASTTWTFTARNQGTATAYGVMVDIELADQTIHGHGDQFKEDSALKCSGNIPTESATSTCSGGDWTIGSLGAGEEISIIITPRLVSGLSCCTNPATNWSVPARAVIENTVPVEEERFKGKNGNNAAIGWIYVGDSGGSEVPNVQYWLEVSVDDLLAEAGDPVKFSFKANAISGGEKFIDEAKVRLKLDNGMGDPTATTLPTSHSFAAAPGLTRTWDWTIGKFPTISTELVVSTTLDSTLPTGVAPSDLCITAELTARPDNSEAGRDTSAEICLREDVALLQTGGADLWDLYSCVGVATYPCSDTDTLELVVNGKEAATAAGVWKKTSNEAILDPGKVFIQVKDPDGRREHSNAVVWRTGSNANSDSNDAGIIPGVITFIRLPTPDFNKFSFSISDSTTGGKPGTVRVSNQTNTGTTLLNIDTKTSFGPVSTSTLKSVPTLFEFGDLGTYRMDITATATYASSSTDYSDTSTFTFHVGPVSELAVSDGDGGLAPAGTRAFTIVAVNNGPDDAPAVEVTGLNDGDYVSHSATGGSFDSTTGVWTIGEMKNSDFYQDVYGRDGEVLTIITSAAVDAEITASISNTEDYKVCIDSEGEDVVLSSPSSNACTTEDSTNTWHTAKYYDYISENDSATIKAKDGTGAKLPSLSGSQSRAASVVVRWSPVAEVNGRKATHYEVRKLPNVWTRKALETSYVDTGVRVGDTPRYRVRAINDRGHGGPWSAPLSVSVAPEPTPTPTPRPTPEPDPEPSNTSPRFTDGGSTTRHIQENSEPGTDVGSPVAATDRNRDSLTYALTGTDADSFEIVASSGQIRTKAELDYETKTRYRVTVTVSDGKNSRGEPNENVDDVIDVTIAVTNQGEQGHITFSEALPVVGTAIGAELTDPDGGLSRVSWAWERSADGDAWAGIAGATSASYTPADGDAGHYLRATASYTDGHGPSKSATAALSVPVTALSVSQRYDGDGDGSISLGEALKAAGDYRAGVITYDEAIAVANLYFESQS